MPHSEHIQLSLSEIFTALSYALDITEGQPRGHSIRCCWIGVHVGKKLGLKDHELWELYYTLLLKDAGCSSNAARLFQLYGSDDLQTKQRYKKINSHKITHVLRFIVQNTSFYKGRLDQLKRVVNFIRHGHDLTNELIQTRCERGANITRRLGFSEAVAKGVHHLDEHYNGQGRPAGLKGSEIPLYSRIALLSQVADVFYNIGGSAAAEEEVSDRSSSWFDPRIAEAFLKLSQEQWIWQAVKDQSVEDLVSSLEPRSSHILVNEDYLDTVAKAFADVIDAKSPYTFGHSSRVADYADMIAKKIGLDDKRRQWFYRGSLLHDIGKLGVSNAILDKPDKLTDEEFAQVKLHPKYTEEILSKISVFRELAPMAGAHHERLDGKGYYKGLKGEEILLETRILTLADVFDALSAKRPYREAMPLEKVFMILEDMKGSAIDESCLQALKDSKDQVITYMEQRKNV